MSLNSSNNVAASSKLFQYKLVLLGESAVGKSSIATSLVKGKFDEVQESTIGAAFFTQTLPFEDHSVKFEIWDTAGQERYHSLAPMYYRGAQAAIVVYDLTKAESFDRAINWVKELQRQASSQIVIALVGNKLDLVQSGVAEDDGARKEKTNSNQEEPSSSSVRAVSVEQAKQIATKFGLLFWETSAKTGENVQAVFRDIAAKLPKTVPLNEMLFKSSSSLNRPVNLAGGSSGEERTMKCC